MPIRQSLLCIIFSDIYIFKIVLSFIKTFEKVKISKLIANEVNLRSAYSMRSTALNPPGKVVLY